MPVYNAAQFLHQSLNSIFKQNYPNLNVLIFDDGSTDNSLLTIKNYVRFFDTEKRIILSYMNDNQGVAAARHFLVKQSRTLNPSAYILWLDADDLFIEKDTVYRVVTQMQRTHADIGVFNFSIKYEEPSLIKNAIGLIRDQKNHCQILQQIYSTPTQSVSPLQVDLFSLSSLGCTKCYAPSVYLTKAANYPFEDFVTMAALLCANKITAINPQTPLLNYLRRTESLSNQRTPDNFTIHIPTQLSYFFDAVINTTQNDLNRVLKIRQAQQFVKLKVYQYKLVLNHLISTNKIFNQDLSSSYSKITKNLLRHIAKHLINS